MVETKRVKSRFSLISILFVLLALSISVASASPACGSTITTNTVLDADMSCAGTAITIGADNIVLDCAGHSITGANTGNGIYLSGRTGVTVKNCVVTKFANGIRLDGSSNNNIINNNASSNSYGIGLWYSSNNILNNNIASNNDNTGISLGGSSNNNIIANNIANSNKNSYFGYGYGGGIWLNSGVYTTLSNNIIFNNTANNNYYSGIIISSSSHNTISNNTANNNRYGGIELEFYYNKVPGFNNTIVNNIVSSNGIGIWLRGGPNNTITDNIASSNDIGIRLGGCSNYGPCYSGPYYSSSNNQIYNNLFNNINNVQFYGAIYPNYWSTTKTSGTRIIEGCESFIGGNVWKSPFGTGFSETCTDADLDGICDSASTLATGNIDYFSLKGNDYYQDSDGDGLGNAAIMTKACSAPSGYVNNGVDCNDNDAAIHPGATEVCNGIDDNCNGQIDEGVTSTFYRDIDADGYGDAAQTIQACTLPSGYVNNADDQCPAVYGKVFLGCPYASLTNVKVHYIDQANWGICPDGKTSCIVPGSYGWVKVFDRNSHDFQALWGKNPGGSMYSDIFWNDVGMIKGCWTDSNGSCTIGENKAGDYLVLAFFVDPQWWNWAGVIGLPVSSSDYKEGVAEKELSIIININKDGSIKSIPASKKTLYGSALDIVYPEIMDWGNDTSVNYPFILTSDSDWTTDVCLSVPDGYNIVGDSCQQAFVNGETKTLLFQAVDIGSPKPDMKMKIKATHQGKVQNLDLDIPGQRDKDKIKVNLKK